MKNVILVVDFGTSNVRVLAFNTADGAILASASKKYSIISPAPGLTEFDPEEVWENSCWCMDSVVRKLDFLDISIKAIGFSFIGASLFALDENYKPVANCILCFDSRAAEEGKYLASLFPEPYYKFNEEKPAAKILYMKKHNPEQFQKAAYFVSCQQFILQRLGLPMVWDWSTANCHSFYDCSTNTWDSLILDAVGITAASMGGNVVGSGTIVGKIDHYAKTQFIDPVPVVIGGHDGDIGILGFGLTDELGDAIGEVSGTFDHVGYLSNDDTSIPKPRTSHPGPLPDTSVVMKGFPTYGAAVEWFMREIVGDTSKESYENMWAHCNFLESTSKLRFHPAFAGSNAIIQKLSIATTKYDIFQALIESLTFESRFIIDQIRDAKQGECRRIRVGGGPASSDDWMQLKADVLGIQVERLTNNDISGLGAAIVAANAVKIYPTLEEIIARMVKVQDTFEPVPENYETLNRKYQDYLSWTHKNI